MAASLSNISAASRRSLAASTSDLADIILPFIYKYKIILSPNRLALAADDNYFYKSSFTNISLMKTCSTKIPLDF